MKRSSWVTFFILFPILFASLHLEVQGKYAEFFRDHGFEAFRLGDVECGRNRYDGKWWDDVHLASLTVTFSINFIGF